MSVFVGGPGLRCEVQPDRGARIVSLQGEGGWEWLAASERTPSTGTGLPFVRPGMGGWDEVAPTVQADQDAEAPAGTPLPDHGDVWNIPWRVDRAGPGELAVSVALPSMPVALSRTITATGQGLRFHYRATSTSRAPLPLLWCAHPQFAAGPGVDVALESGGVRIAPELTEMYPGEGKDFDFAARPRHATMPAGTSLKAFIAPETRADAAVLSLPTGRSLRLDWDSTQLPYLGLFWDNGEFAAEPVLAVEPSTGWGERLSAAARQQRVLAVSQGQHLEWELHLSETAVSVPKFGAPRQRAQFWRASLPTTSSRG